MPLFSDNDTPHRDSDAQTPKPHRRPRSKGPRVSMGSAREELQNEARRIGMLSPDGTHPTPAQQYADHHADEFDILAPLRGSMGVLSTNPWSNRIVFLNRNRVIPIPSTQHIR